MKGSILRRLTRATVAATAASLLLLAGCSGASTASKTPSPATSTASAAEAKPTAADVAALKAVTMDGAAGAEPTVTFKQPFTVTAPVARVISEGTGAPLTAGQILSMNYISVSGADGSKQGTTYGAAPDRITLGDTALLPVLNEALTGQEVGSRMLLAIPSTKLTTILAIEVTDAKTIPARAKGTAVSPPAGLPTVTLDNKGTPTITPVKSAAPAAIVIQPLIKGSGPAVTAGQTVTFQYTGALWNGTVFDSSWTKGAPFSTAIGTGAVIKGWDQGLVGQTVGSQVLLVVPPSLGYGDTAQGAIPASSTLIFVVDILDAG